MFFLFGNKTINIVFYGAFFWLMLTAYKNKIRVNLLGETKNIVYESKNLLTQHILTPFPRQAEEHVQRSRPEISQISHWVNRLHFQELW